jgi:hypothetical protein
MLELPPEMRFIDPQGQTENGLLGTALDNSKTIAELQQSQRCLELFTQTPIKELKEESKPEKTKRLFKAAKPEKETKPEPADKEEPTDTASLCVFDKYLSLGGSEQMLDMVARTVEQYRNKKMKELFCAFLKDIKMFSILPGFSELFFKP